jgi:phage shock protein A
MWALLKKLFQKKRKNKEANPIDETSKQLEANIRDLKKDLTESMQALSELKSLTMRTRRQIEQTRAAAEQQERKAIIFLEKAEKGEIAEEEADRLAAEALERKSQILRLAQGDMQNMENYVQMVAKLEDNIRQNRSQINQFEGELKSLKVRSKVSETSQKLNKSLSGIDTQGSNMLLEKIRDQVNEQEALAQAYNHVTGMQSSAEDEVDKILGNSISREASNDLMALKQKRKQQIESPPTTSPPPSDEADNTPRFKLHKPTDE